MTQRQGRAAIGDPGPAAAITKERRLAEVLSEFARTLVTDFPLQGILDHLIERIVDVLPVTAAGVTLLAPGSGPHLVAASNPDALRFEQLQTSTGEGPCVTAFETGEAVAVPDMRAGDARFPQFCAEAVAAGLTAVFTFPLRHGQGQLGALDLFRDIPGPLDEWDLATAQTLADVTAAYLLNARARQDASEGADLLREIIAHDGLTGLANRSLLEQRLQHAAERASRTHHSAAVMFVDLDRFKQVNDTHGHSAGDALLVAVANRLSDLLRPGDTLARISGDEFVILCEDLDSADDVPRLVARVEQAFASTFAVASGEPLDALNARITTEQHFVDVAVNASIGIAFAGSAADIGPRLVQDADTAMYQAKRKGGGRHQVLDLREAGQASARVVLEHDLRIALANGELTIAFQPVVRTSDGLVTGVEALLRWTHPRRGPVPPALAIAAAERSSLIIDLGRWVLERACLDHLSWTRSLPGDLGGGARLQPIDLAVNVSVRQFMHAGFAVLVADVLAKTEMDPDKLVLEITEGIFLDGARALTVLADLRSLGVHLALDDFGTGYSSLSYLRRFPVDIVKIDRTFVADIGRQAAGGEIIGAVTNLAHVLGMSVTAEGAESAQQVRELYRMGCDHTQGFFYARPMPSTDLQRLLHSRGGRPIRLPTNPSADNRVIR